VQRPVSEPTLLPPADVSPAPAPAPGPAPAPAPEAAPEALEDEDDTEPDGDAGLEADDLAPEPVAAGSAGTTLATRRPTLTPAPQPTGPRVISPVRVPAREWGGTKVTAVNYAGPRWPTDIKIVVGALIVTGIVAAIMVAILASNALIGAIVAVVLLLGLAGFLWITRL
jgi:hypothetical protein